MGVAQELTPRRPRRGRAPARRSRPACAPPRRARGRGRPGASASSGEGIEVRLPSRAQAALVSPSAPACVPQDHLERVLEEHVRGLGPARIERGAELLALAIGPDGARSAVRSALRIDMRGSEDVLEGATALVRAPLWGILGEHRYGIYWVTLPGSETTVLPAGPGDRWGVGHLHEGPGRLAPPTAEGMAERLRRAAGVPDLPVAVDWVGTFTSAAQIADRFREGRAFLVGDAAHRVTPRGGTGMNTAIHDGVEPRVEAGLGVARVGRRGAPRCLRGRAPPRGRAQRRAVGRPGGVAPHRRRGAAHRPRPTHRPPLDRRGGRPGVDHRPARPRPHVAHRTARRGLAGGGRRAARRAAGDPAPPRRAGGAFAGPAVGGWRAAAPRRGPRAWWPDGPPGAAALRRAARFGIQGAGASSAGKVQVPWRIAGSGW